MVTRQPSHRGSFGPILLNYSGVTCFVPLLKSFSINGNIALVISSLEPIRGKDTTTVLAGTAKTALRSLGEDYPSVTVDSEGLAGSCHIWQDGTAVDVVLSGLAVHPFSVLAGLVKLLALDVELLLAAEDGLLEGNVVGVVEDWWRFGVAYGK